jgi:hypothetical protein
MATTVLSPLAIFGLSAMLLLDGSAASFAAPFTYVDPEFSQGSEIVRVAVACGRRGCAAAHRGVGYPAHRPVGGAVVVRPGARWVRPYRWPAGGAIAAGAAIGFVAAATAVAWAPAPPQPGLCWYYTDPSRHAGFWDSCP